MLTHATFQPKTYMHFFHHVWYIIHAAHYFLLITLTILSKEQKLWNAWLCNFLYYPLTSRAVIAQSVQRWAMGWMIGVLGFNSQWVLGIFLFTTMSRTALGPTQPPIQWVPRALSLGVKRPGHESDHSPPSSAEVKNVWSYTSTPQYTFMAWCFVQHRDNFTFTFFTFTFLLHLTKIHIFSSTLCSQTPLTSSHLP
jgi:hypothetical protein